MISTGRDEGGTSLSAIAILSLGLSAGSGPMRAWFSKIENRTDALKVIGTCSTVFFVLAALQVGAALLVFLFLADKYSVSRIGAETAFNLLFTAAIVAFLAGILRTTKSRIAAVLLLLTALVIIGASLVTPVGAPKGNLFLALVAVWAGARATLATVRLHGRFAEPDAHRAQTPPTGNADFVGHPDGGVESTTATPTPNPLIDREKWAALLKYDDEIAMIAEKLQPLGQKWVDEFAQSYLVLNDKKYLPNIVQKIIRDARMEAEQTRA